MTKDKAFALVEQAISQGGWLRFRKDYHPLKWRFYHPRHRVVCWGKTALAAVREFVKMEARFKAHSAMIRARSR